MALSADSVAAADRYEFGENWARFVRHLTDERIADAEESLRAWLGPDALRGRRFLDAGSGSGLFSLAARRLGASVHSFDYDPLSVRCTTQLRDHVLPNDASWTVERGSALDRRYLKSLGTFDDVYSWGVLHHTGAMWDALDAVCARVARGGKLFISLYNDQGWISRYWTIVKSSYNRRRWTRPFIAAAHAPYLLAGRWLSQRIRRATRRQRGMRLREDFFDWLGGYPFEVATAEAVIAFTEARGFTLERMKTCGRRHGCNEFLFTART